MTDFDDDEGFDFDDADLDFDDPFEDDEDDDAFDDEDFDDDLDEDEEDGAPGDGSGRSRAFLIGAVLMSLTLCLGIIAIVALTVLRGGNPEVAQRQTENAAVFTAQHETANPPTSTVAPTDTSAPTATSTPTNTIEASPTRVIAQADTDTPAPATTVSGATEQVTGTTVGPTDTPVPSDTPTSEFTPSNTPTPLIPIAGQASPTRLPTLPSGETVTPSATDTPNPLTATPIGGLVTTTPGTQTSSDGPDDGTGGGEAAPPFATPGALPDSGLADDVGLPGLALAGLGLIVALVAVRWIRTTVNQ